MIPLALEGNNIDAPSSAPSGLIPYGIRYLDRQFSNLEQFIPRLGIDEDIEIVHDIRVAVRRIRAALSILQPALPKQPFRKASRTCKALADALTTQRDRDVQVAFLNSLCNQNPPESTLPGLRRVRLIALDTPQDNNLISVNERAKTVLENITKVRSWNVENLLSEGPVIDSQFFSFASALLNERLDTVLRYERAIFFPNNQQTAHCMRIATKCLRYSMEFFEAAYDDRLKDGLKAAKEMQQTLGDLHDCDVWLDFLDAVELQERKRIQQFFGDETKYQRIQIGIQYLRENRYSERQFLFQTFSETWSNWKETFNRVIVG